MSHILIKDENIDRIVIGFMRDDGEYEYTLYLAEDGGVITLEDSPLEDIRLDIAEHISSWEDMDDYTVYELSEIRPLQS